METWTVEIPDDAAKGRKRRYQQRKGVAFVATGIGMLAPSVGYGEASRPLWASFACEDGGMRPFLANLQLGRKIVSKGGKDMEFMRSTQYEIRVQRLGDGMSSAVVYRPSYFTMNPGPIEDVGEEQTIEYILMPDAAYLATAGIPAAEVKGALRSARNVPSPEPSANARYDEKCPELDDAFVALAALSAAYLDHRTRCPLLADLGFYTYLLKRMIEKGVARYPDNERGRRSESIEWRCDKRFGYPTPLIVNALGSVVEALIAQCVAEYIPAE